MLCGFSVEMLLLGVFWPLNLMLRPRGPNLADFTGFDKQIFKVTPLCRPLYPLNPNIFRSISLDDAVQSIS